MSPRQQDQRSLREVSDGGEVDEQINPGEQEEEEKKRRRKGGEELKHPAAQQGVRLISEQVGGMDGGKEEGLDNNKEIGLTGLFSAEIPQQMPGVAVVQMKWESIDAR
ncbi:unnamed protein product [Pleuronectes platessa]|uniref:Uncharacterized protein n=1 Tax=Pleuronectes platessa TaxID=8262 RepID=A0A9N7Z5Y2_PLEPL|nr:unnamed protein product [Pleuronectes platessa]